MKKTFVLLLGLAIFASCNKDPQNDGPQNDPKPEDVKAKIELSSSKSISASADGTTAEIKFNATLEWSAEASEDWVKLSATSGAAGDATITVTIDPTTAHVERTANVNIKCKTVTESISIAQESAPWSFDEYCDSEQIIIYDDQVIPSSETITITATGAGAEDVDFACTEDPAEGSKCIRWNATGKKDGQFDPTMYVKFTFDPLINLSAFTAKDYSIEFKLKSTSWIHGNLVGVVLQDSAQNADGTPWMYVQNAIQEFDAETPKNADNPDGTIAPGTWASFSIPIDEMWGRNKEWDGTKIDWGTKTLKGGSNGTDKWLPDLNALGSLYFISKGPNPVEGEDSVIIWIDEIKICKRSFPLNK